MKKNIKLNNLIKSLIASFKDYDHNLKNRFKVDSIILGLEENVDKNLNKLIHLSDSRYKYVKFGVKLQNILDRQKIKYENLNRQIMNDNIYSSNDLDLEKSKLFKSVVTIKNKEITDIREKLISMLRESRDKINKKKDIKLNTNNKIKSEAKNQKLKIDVTENNNHNISSSIRKSIRNISNITNKSLFSKRQSIIINNNKNEGQNKYDNIMKEDYDNFFSTIDSYHTFLGQLKTISNYPHNHKGIKISKDNFEHIQSNLNPNSLKFLTYTENENLSKSKKEIKKDIEFDLQKIKKIKINHDRNNKLKNYISKSLSKTQFNPSISGFNTDRITNIKKLDTITDSNTNSFDKSNFPKISNVSNYDNKTSRNFVDKNLYNYKNTANIVLNETENGLYNNLNFINKRKIFNNYFDKCFFNDNLNTNIVNNSNSNLIDCKKEYVKRKSNIYNHEIYEYGQKRKERIKKEFQNIYEQKKIQWKKEEKMKKLQNSKENQKRNEIEYFLLNSQNKNKFFKNK